MYAGGLTTPFEVVDVPGGVLLRFLKTGAGYDADRERPESADDKWARAQAAGQTPCMHTHVPSLMCMARAWHVHTQVLPSEALFENGARPAAMGAFAAFLGLPPDGGASISWAIDPNDGCSIHVTSVCHPFSVPGRRRPWEISAMNGFSPGGANGKASRSPK